MFIDMMTTDRMKIATTNPRYAVYLDGKLVDLVRVQDRKALSVKSSLINKRHTQSKYFKRLNPDLDSGCDFQLVTGEPGCPSWGELIDQIKRKAKPSTRGRRYSDELKAKVIRAKLAGREESLIVADFGVSRRSIAHWLKKAEDVQLG